MKKQQIIEICLLVGLSIVIGFLYTYITHQGFFAPPKQAKAHQQLEIIALPQAKEAYYSGSVRFIDARNEFEFKLGHIRGAIDIPLHDFDRYQTVLSEIPKDVLLIVYCDGVQCNSSIELAKKLSELGFSNIKVFFGGWQEWRTAGLPITQ
ncbi:MAG TPA: rhodanese-like domain-containing protein [Bacteroidota bacterium]|nr:rhodanese-like domain-containing protein [Bacteroidota bacterium]